MSTGRFVVICDFISLSAIEEFKTGVEIKPYTLVLKYVTVVLIHRY